MKTLLLILAMGTIIGAFVAGIILGGIFTKKIIENKVLQQNIEERKNELEKMRIVRLWTQIDFVEIVMRLRSGVTEDELLAEGIGQTTIDYAMKVK